MEQRYIKCYIGAMLITPKLVFIHLHKSGGTFVNEMFLRCLPGAKRIGYHLPYRELPTDYARLPVLGVVRNPWSYYVSWYHFQHAQPQPNALFAICSNSGRLGFDATIRNLLGLRGDEARLKLLEQYLPDNFRPAGLNLTKKCLPELRASSMGFYGFLHQRMYRGAPAPHILRMESLRSELDHILHKIGHLPNGPLEDFLHNAPAMNISRHGDYRTYYDTRLRDHVAQEDEKVIETYRYTF